jgi:hypothetical protein
MIGRPLATARSTSRLICGDSFACCEKISTSTLAPVIAVTIDSPQSIPGTMSRGAIQHRMPACSSVAQAASAEALSGCE